MSTSVSEGRDGAAQVDAWIAAAPSESRGILSEIRKAVKQALPDAEELISYRMPAFRHRRVFFFYAGFKRHIGIFPPLPVDHLLAKELQPYRAPEGDLRFALAETVPIDLIRRVAIPLAQHLRTDQAPG